MTSSSWLQLAHKTAIVTGAGSGIGAKVVMAFLSEGCNVVLADRNVTSMEQILEEQKQHDSSSLNPSTSASSLIVPCDITDPEQVQSLIHQADEFALKNNSFSNNNNNNNTTSGEEKIIDATTTTTAAVRGATILVNCAGITKDNFTSQMTLKEWDDVIKVNLTGTFLTCRAFVEKSRLESMFIKYNDNDAPTTTTNNNNNNFSSGSIINVGSIVSEQGNIGQVNYSASKGGVLGITKSLAKEVALYNIRVNAILPGFIETNMTKQVPTKVKNKIYPKIILKQRGFGQPDDVSNLICFLASCKRSGYITGECINVSGMISL